MPNSMPYANNTNIREDIALENFEYEIYEQKRAKVLSVKKARRARAFDKVKAVFIGVLILYIGVESVFTIGHSVAIHHKEAEIQKYETILANKKKENEELLTKISEIVVDKGIREKAILEFSMMIPSNRNIIYFHKNDIGYVHYDK